MNKGAIMKTKNVVKYMIILSFILSSSYAVAEESGDIYFGISAGIGDSYHEEYSGVFGYFEKDYTNLGVPLCRCIQFSNDYNVGLNLEYVLFKNDFWSNATNLFITYRNSELVFDAPGVEYETTFYKNLDSITTNTIVKNDLEMINNFIDLDLLYKTKFNSFIQFGLSLGPYIAIPLSTPAKEIYKIGRTFKIDETSEDLKLETIPPKTITNEIDIDENFAFWGAKANFFLEYEFLKNIKIIAGLNLTLPLSNYSNEPDWKIRFTYYTFGISYKLN